NITELDIQENGIEDLGGNWLSCFLENFTSLEVLNFANEQSEVNLDALERLVARCNSLKVLKVNKSINLEQLQTLLVHAPQLEEIGTGSFLQELTIRQYSDLANAFSNCKNFHTLSGLWGATSVYLPVLDTVEDKGLEVVGSSCHLLEDLRVFPADPYNQEAGDGVTETGFVAVSRGCRRLHYVLYFCRQMTNDAVATVVQNCPNFTHFRLCIMNPCQPDYLTNKPMDDAFGSNDRGMQCVLGGCPKLRKLEIRDCPFGNDALLSGLERYA
ncbi:hypothetical protein GIB67_040321, partial [Kingdonia uniflora]